MTAPAGSGVTNKGTTYADGSQVTSTNLNDIVDDAVFNTNAVDDSTIGLNSDTPKALFVKNQGIDTAQIADDAVTTVKITDANITTAKIANDAVTGDKISDSAALPDGVTATTQPAGDDSTKVATTAFVQDMRPKFVTATGGTHSLTLQNQLNGVVQTYQIADFTSGDSDFATDKITGIVIQSYNRSNQNTNINEATLPDGQYTVLSRASAFGGGDDVEVTTTTTIPINSDTTSISLRYTVNNGAGISNETAIRGFIIQPNL